MFSPGAGFYRDSFEKDYKGYGSFKYKGRVLDPGIIYNFLIIGIMIEEIIFCLILCLLF